MQDLEEIKNKIRLVDYIQGTGIKLKKVSHNVYGVNPCPICGHNDNFRVYDETNSFHCFSLDEGGTIIDYFIKAEGLSRREAVDKLYKITNTPKEPTKEFKPRPSQEEHKEDAKKLEEIHNFVNANFKKMQNKETLIKYLETRGINKEAIEKYHLFISNDDGTQRLYIPIIENGKATAYLGRAIDDTASLRYKNSKGTTINPFNLKYIKEKAQENEAIYICEGVFDAISIEEQGLKAISLNSTQNVSKFLDDIRANIETAKDYVYIIATDSDEARTKSKRRVTKRIDKTWYNEQIRWNTNKLQNRETI